MSADQDTIKVVIRFRGKEKLNARDQAHWSFHQEDEVTAHQDDDKREETFTFDSVLSPVSSQADMYNQAAKETVEQFTKGFNGTIFAYGQSGSGKTYTMLGPEQVIEQIQTGEAITEDIQQFYGVIPRAIHDFFEFINQEIENENAQFQIGMNYFEIYKESLNNLLGSDTQLNQNLKIIENSKVLNAEPTPVQTPEQIFAYIQRGQNRVQMDCNSLNDRSSRSHTILVLEYKQLNKDGSIKSAKLNLVDLAGSERISKTGAAGKILEEAKKINQSLTSLGRVILALSTGEAHVPFRDSKLTHLLKESLGGNSKTTLICTCSQRNQHFEESFSSLKFAQRTKLVKNKAVTNIVKSPEQMRLLIIKLKNEIKMLKSKLGMGLDSEIQPSDMENGASSYEPISTTA